MSDGLFWMAVTIGLTYWPGSELDLPISVLTLWKGAGVSLLAVWAGMQARDRDGWLLAALLGFGALGDVLLEITSLHLGAAAFLVGHLLAIWLYARNRGPVWRWQAFLLVPLIAIISIWLPEDRALLAPIALYSFVLACMAVCAAQSCFQAAAVGAWLFVASDLLIFAGLGVLSNSFVPDLLVWPLYFVGQVLIAWDVARTLAERTRDEAVHDRI